MAPELSFECMRQPLRPDAYQHILQADAIELAALSGNEQFVRVTDLHEANPKDFCESLVSEHAHDSRRKASLILAEQGTDVTGRKRRRAGAENGACFPPKDPSGKRINQGYGGDLSFLPLLSPTVCKQSATFARYTEDQTAKWEVVFPLHEHRQAARLSANLQEHFKSLACCQLIGMSVTSTHRLAVAGICNSICSLANHICNLLYLQH